MCVTDRHDMTLAVKVALNPNTTNQPIRLCAGIFLLSVWLPFIPVYMLLLGSKTWISNK